MRKLNPVLLVTLLILTLANPAAGQATKQYPPTNPILTSNLVRSRFDLSKKDLPAALPRRQAGLLWQAGWPPRTSRKDKFWHKTKTKVGVAISVDYWRPKGSFSMVGSPGNSANSWKLKHPVDSNLYLGNLTVFEIKLSHIILIDFSYGGGDLKKGRLVDTDWDKDGNVRDLAYATSNGKTQYLSGFVSYRLMGSCPIRDKSSNKIIQISRGILDISLGYHQLKNSVSYKNPRILIKAGSRPGEPGWDPSWEVSWKEVINKYDLTYSGIGIRLRGEYRMNRAWSIRGLIGYLPSVNARYRGVRNPKREPNSGNPPAGRLAERIKAKGNAPEAEIKLCIYPTTNLSCWIGYKSISFKTEGEDESDTYWAGSEEELKTDLKGWLFGFGYQF